MDVTTTAASFSDFRVAINQENLEYSDFFEHEKLGILREFCTISGKNCNKQSIFSSSFKYLCKIAVDWLNSIIRISGSSDPVQ